MSKTVQVVRQKPGLLTPINGVAFKPHAEGSISEPITVEVAEKFLCAPGYVVVEDTKAAERQLAAAEQKAADEKAAKEAAEKEAAATAAAAKAAADAAAEKAAVEEAGKKAEAKGSRSKSGDTKQTTGAPEGEGSVF